MKKKSPNKGSSNKKFDSGEIREIQTSSESWTKCSFIELLVTILVKTRGLIDSFYFHIRFSPDISRNSKKDYKFLRNVSVFFVLFFFIPIYRSDNRRISKQIDFSSLEIQEKIHSERDSIKKEIKDYLKFGVGKYDLSSSSHFNKSFFGLYLKPVSKPHFFLLGKTSRGHSINLQKLEENLTRSSLSLKKEIDASLPNYIECNSNRFFSDYYWYLWGGVQQQQIEWLAKVMQIEGDQLVDPGSFFQNLPTNFIFLKGKNSCDQTAKNENDVNHSFHSQRIFSRQSQKYYWRLLLNFIFPFNPVYSICQQNYFKNRTNWNSWKIWEHLLPIHLIFNDSNILKKKMELRRDLKNNKSNLYINLAKEKEDPHSALQLLTPNRSREGKVHNNWKKKFINVYLSILVQTKSFTLYDCVGKRYKEYLNQFLPYFYWKENLLLGPYHRERKNMTQKSLGRKAIAVKKLIRGIERYDKLIFIVYKQIQKINNWVVFDLSTRFRSTTVLRKIESSNLFKRFFRKENSRSFNDVLDFLRPPFNQFHRYNSSFKKSERYSDQSILTNFCFDWPNLTSSRLINPFSIRLNNSLELFILLPKLQRNSLKKYELVLIPNSQISWKRKFFIYSDSVSTWDCESTDQRFFITFLEFYEFALRILGDPFSVTKDINSTLANSQQASNFLVTMLYKNRIKAKTPPVYQNYFFGSILVPKPDGKMVVKLYPDTLRYVLAMKDMNMKMSGVLGRILSHFELDSFECKDSQYKETRVLGKGNRSFEYSRFGQNYSSAKLISLDGYISWFFTPEWWGYYTDLFSRIYRQTFSMIRYYLKYLEDFSIQIVIKKFLNSWKFDRDQHDFSFGWNSEKFLDQTERIVPNKCLNYRIINNWNILWTILTLVSFISFFKQNFLSILIGSNSVCLWKHFETIEYLRETSRTFHSIRSMYITKERSQKMDNFIIRLFEDLMRCVRDIQFYLLMNKGLDDWLINNKCLDLSRREKSPLVQSLITRTRIKGYGFKSYPKRTRLSNVSGYRVTNQQGFSYLRYLSEILKKKYVNYPFLLTNKWIHLASSQKMIFSRTLLKIGIQQIPVPLQFGLSHAKGILLIGPIETGRSYLIKNLAANSRVPLLGIHMDKLLYNKPDVITESWINILIESLRGLNLILDLANEMSPCIIWIRNIHRLDVNRPTRNIESEPAFLLGILLKYFQTNPIRSRTKRNITIIGSTHLPGKVDPALISADRLDQIINIRFSNNSLRKNHFFILLNTKSLRLRSELLYLNELESKITGYTTRDLAAFTNEVSLINIARNESFVCNNTIELAFHRQILRFTHMSDKSYILHNFGILVYKIGKAIIQNLLIESSSMNPLSISNYSWKKNFYHLAQSYLEPSVENSIMKEFAIMIHALSFLAGIAARDSWFLLEEASDSLIALDRSVENDLSLAFSILESIPIEFSRLEICEVRFCTYKQQTNEKYLAKNSSNIIQHELVAVTGEENIRNDSKDESCISRHIFLSGLDSKLQSTAWSPRSWRLSFCRSHLFDWIKRPNDSKFRYKFEFPKSEKTNIETQSHNNPNGLMGTGKQQLIYERILPRVRKRNVQELEFQLELILLEEQSEILGFRRPSTQYQMEYQVDTKPRPSFFIGKRILWDPTGSSIRIRNPIFSRREFFVDEEILRRLYVTYGVRRERERSLFNHKIKRFFLRRGYNKELINKLSIRWWNQLPIHDEQNIDTWKRIEGIGVRLRRPQVFTPVYLYQRWLIENLPEKFPRFELLTQRQRWLGVTNLLLSNSFAYTTILESYQYLLEFFSSNKVLLDRSMKTLVKKKWLFQKEISYLIYNCNKNNRD